MKSMQRNDWVVFWLTCAAVLLLTGGPFLLAALTAGPDFRFGGFLLNPLDGNTYLAKMAQGWDGAWRYRLAYTAEPGAGAYLFLFYLGLGHLARWIGLDLRLVFHLARLAGTVGMLGAMRRFFAAALADRWQANTAFVLAAFGSGLGWLLAAFTGFTSDFWVAEAYPFLSAYVNPHFPLSLALILILLTPGRGDPKPILEAALGAAAGLLLALISPFGIVVAAMVMAGRLVWDWIDQTGSISMDHQWMGILARLAGVLTVGGPVLLYDIAAARLDPVLGGWNAQNLTPTPPVWDIVIAFLPVLAPAVWGGWLAGRRNEAGGRWLAVWALAGMLMLFLPFGLQRRFILGYYLPLAGLAAISLADVAARWKRKAVFLTGLVFCLAIPTNLMILIGGVGAAATHPPILYLYRDEAAAFEWIRANTGSESVFLTGPQTGMFLPAHTGRRVIYGHPFETVNAAVEEKRVTAFFSGHVTAQETAELLARADYVLVGPRELDLPGGPVDPGGKVVFRAGRTVIYQVKP
jgi:hypothetical protein